MSNEQVLSRAPSGDWDAELVTYWRRTGLSAHYLHMAELTMRLFGRSRAYRELEVECKGLETFADIKPSKPSVAQGDWYEVFGACTMT